MRAEVEAIDAALRGAGAVLDVGGQTKVKWLPRIGLADVHDLLRRIAPRDPEGKPTAGWDLEIPAAVVRDAASEILAFEGLTPNDLYRDECVLQEVDEYEGNYLDETGKAHEEGLPVSYAWYPWALATGFQLVENPRYAALLTRVQRRRIQRQIGIWVDAERTGGLEWAKRMSGDASAWAVAETYMGLGRCAVDGGSTLAQK